MFFGIAEKRRTGKTHTHTSLWKLRWNCEKTPVGDKSLQTPALQNHSETPSGKKLSCTVVWNRIKASIGATRATFCGTFSGTAEKCQHKGKPPHAVLWDALLNRREKPIGNLRSALLNRREESIGNLWNYLLDRRKTPIGNPRRSFCRSATETQIGNPFTPFFETG